jgi:hypothetical protein
MKNVLFGLLAINSALILNSNSPKEHYSITLLESTNKDIDTTEKVDSLIVENVMSVEIDSIDSIDILLDAIIQVESRGDSTAIGDGGSAVGVLQIWPIMVEEINRILETQGSDIRYDYNDRYDVKKSIEMFHIWRNYHHPESSWEEIARCWNGGPNGMYLNTTVYYWTKVEKQLNSCQI